MGSCTSSAVVAPIAPTSPTPSWLSSPSSTPSDAFPPSRQSSTVTYESHGAPTPEPGDHRNSTGDSSTESIAASKDNANTSNRALHLQARRNVVLKFRVPRTQSSPKGAKYFTAACGRDPPDHCPVPRLQVEFAPDE